MTPEEETKKLADEAAEGMTPETTPVEPTPAEEEVVAPAAETPVEEPAA